MTDDDIRALLTGGSAPPIETIIANRTGTVRHATDPRTGQRMIVANMTMLVPGVFAGSQGPLYYSADELRRTAIAWNGVPVTLNHPTSNGHPVSASDPAAIVVGVVRNARFEDGALKAEAWLQAERLGSDLMGMIDARRPLEISTGLFLNHTKPGGEWNGKAYRSIATAIRPDHLALLTDRRGACSCAAGDGCCLGAANASGEPVEGLPLPVLNFSDRDKQLPREPVTDGLSLPKTFA